MNRQKQILDLFGEFKKHKKWHSFYLKSIKELIDVLNLPTHEIIECNLADLSKNEDFCLPLFISKEDHFFPSLKSCFNTNDQNQIIAVLNFNQNLDNLSIYYLNNDELSFLEDFKINSL